VSDKVSPETVAAHPDPNPKFLELVHDLQAKQQQEAADRANESWTTTLSRVATELKNGVMNIPNLWQSDAGKEESIQTCITARQKATGFDNQRSFCDGSKQMIVTADSPVAIPAER